MFRVYCVGATGQHCTIYLKEFPTQEHLPVWCLTCNIEFVGVVQ